MWASFQTQGEAVSGFAPGLIVLMSLQPDIPWRVALQQWRTRRGLDNQGRNISRLNASKLMVATSRRQLRPRAQWCLTSPTSSVVPGPVLIAVMTESALWAGTDLDWETTFSHGPGRCFGA